MEEKFDMQKISLSALLLQDKQKAWGIKCHNYYNISLLLFARYDF